MKKQTKIIIVLVSAAVLFLTGVYCLLRFGFSIDVLDRSGWNTKKEMVRYLDYFGRPLRSWQYIEEKLYYFDPETGEMTTGWRKIDKNSYYFDENGIRATGWLQLADGTYYLSENGKMVTGAYQINGQNYYFSDSGSMVTGWQVLNGKRYYFSEEGMTLTGWHKLDGKMYYFTQEGHTLLGSVELDGVRYNFLEDGSILTGWHQDSTGTYFLGDDGKPHIGWLQLDGKHYYFDQDGKQMLGWVDSENERYYLYEDGKMAIGIVEIDSVTNFFTSTGKKVLMTNSQYPVPSDYQLKLVNIEGFRFDSVGRDSLQAMLDACRKAGLSCTINNTYRSKATQQYMWDKSVAAFMADGMTYEEAYAETGKDTALPGHSEHQTGLAVDLNGSTETYAWLAENCWDYGFILRYPEDKTEITGIIYEPWHFRYVGTELAQELKTLGLCMEEYIEQITPTAE